MTIKVKCVLEVRCVLSCFKSKSIWNWYSLFTSISRDADLFCWDFEVSAWPRFWRWNLIKFRVRCIFVFILPPHYSRQQVVNILKLNLYWRNVMQVRLSPVIWYCNQFSMQCLHHLGKLYIRFTGPDRKWKRKLCF